MSAASKFTITGGDIDSSAPDSGSALSKAITLACAAPAAVTLYVRHPNGDPVGRVERDDRRAVRIYRNGEAR